MRGFWDVIQSVADNSGAIASAISGNPVYPTYRPGTYPTTYPAGGYGYGYSNSLIPGMSTNTLLLLAAGGLLLFAMNKRR